MKLLRIGLVAGIGCVWALLAFAQGQGFEPTVRAARLGPVFVENRGQFPEAVRYRTAWPAPVASVTDSGLVLTQVGPTRSGPDRGVVGHSIVLRIEVGGAPATCSVRGGVKAVTRCSYFLGNDASRWITAVPCWSSVMLEVTPDVSVEVHGRNAVLEYDILVAPGGLSTDIEIVVEGATGLRPVGDGALDILTPIGVIRQSPARSWDEDTFGGRRAVETQLVLTGPARFRFEVSGHDPSRTLRIDPGLGYGTFVEGTAQDYGDAIAVDATGAAYVAGTAISTDFPVTPGAFQPERTPDDPVVRDAVVAKLDPTGSVLEYATYLGGHGSEYPSAIKVDPAGNAIVGGSATSFDFPTTDGAFQPALSGSGDGFVTKLNATGTALVYSTYFGGSAPQDTKAETCNDLELDALGRVVFGGFAGSADLPVTPNAVQFSVPNNKGGYIARLSADGSAIDYCTYIGCTELRGVAVDGDMNVYAAGRVGSAAQGLPVTPGAFQTTYEGFGEAYALKINSDGSLAWCTLLSGNDDDRVYGLEVDATGHPIVAGTTRSFNFPTSIAAFDTTYNGVLDGFLLRLAPDGSSLVWGTYIGGSDVDEVWDLAVDAAGNCYVTGDTASPNFPVSVDAFDTTQNVGNAFDACVAKLSADGSQLLYGSYIGGTNGNFDISNGIAVDLQGNPYITGYTISADFPTTEGALDTELSGFTGLFVAKFEITPWKVVGAGLAGADGQVPYLTGIGNLLPGSTNTVLLNHAAPGAPAWLIVGAQALHAPLKGGTLFPAPLVIVPLTAAGGGFVELTFPWPTTIPAGTEIDLQAWLQDAAAVQGFAASNGLTALTP